jgi:hypothetical protein
VARSNRDVAPARSPLSLRPLPGRIFAEPAAALSSCKARRSERLAEAQTDIGMVLGGEPGARLSRRLAMPVSGDTVLRLIRRRAIASSPARPAPRRRPAEGAARRIDGDERRRDATQRQAETALKTLEALAPRTVDAGFDVKCDLIIGIRARWADGQWHVWKFLGHTPTANLAEMAPAKAGRYLIPSRASVCPSGRYASRT